MAAPDQPIFFDGEKLRFRRNAVVRWMQEQLKARGVTLNDFPLGEFPQDDVDQFFQLTGYSLGGYCELADSDIVSRQAADRAWAALQAAKTA